MMAVMTKKLIICIDTYRDDDDEDLRAVRILSEHTLKVMGEAELGAWREKDAVLAAVDNFYKLGGFRAS